MADDFGDDSGDKLLDWSIRLIIEHGRTRAYSHTNRFATALRNAQGQLGADGATPISIEAIKDSPDGGKLDLAEFEGIEGWEQLREVIGDELEGRGIAHEWFTDEPAGKQYLLFRTEDARGLSDAFGALAERAEAAQERAVAAIERSRGIEHGRPEPSRDADRGPDDPERAQAPGGDPRRKIPLREKVKLVREYADELSRTGRDARTPDRAAAQQRERK